jgi:ubiquinone/menaquinone biosynthesis C-methylase UbiE
MMRDGWTGTIVNVDFSEVVVSQMKAKYGGGGTTKMEYVCADITKRLPFEPCSFDLIICKAALDVVLSGCKASIRTMVQESYRVLARGHGIFFLVTHGNPDSRLEFLEYKNEINHYWQGAAVHKISPAAENVVAADKYVDGD